jgi:hypothetical protein
LRLRYGIIIKRARKTGTLFFDGEARGGTRRYRMNMDCRPSSGGFLTR